ncbi:hypothetical protein CDL15_Pgr015013 [Punica granatum]|uniref:Uncharacterized protein n=1 Tax=Punica granatum TaxID=22663 RepID=A0A218WZQ4_PUNGR|nr:hypothetical protein CDL15_Pgr015013 [Punica granatum]
MKLLRRCFAPGTAVCLICRKPTLLLDRLFVALASSWSRHWDFCLRGGCSLLRRMPALLGWLCFAEGPVSCGAGLELCERLRTLLDRGSKSVVILAFVVPVILALSVSHGVTNNV